MTAILMEELANSSYKNILSAAWLKLKKKHKMSPVMRKALKSTVTYVADIKTPKLPLITNQYIK